MKPDVQAEPDAEQIGGKIAVGSSAGDFGLFDPGACSSAGRAQQEARSGRTRRS